MDEKRFRRRDDVRTDPGTEPAGAPTQTVDPPMEQDDAAPNGREARGRPRVPRPRRTPVLRATPTAEPPPAGASAADGAPLAKPWPTAPPPAVGQPPPVDAPQVEPPPVEEPPVEEARVEESPVEEARVEETPTTEAQPADQSATAPPDSAEAPPDTAEAPTEPAVKEPRRGLLDRAQSVLPGRAAIPTQRRVEREPAATDPAVQELPGPSVEREPAEPVDERPPQQYVDQRPPQQYVDQRPAQRYVDERPAQRYVDERPARERDDDSSPDRAEKAPGGPSWNLRVPTLNLRTVGALLLAVAVVFWLGRGLFAGEPAGQESDPQAEGQKQSVPVPKQKQKTKPVVIDGKAIRAAGAVITLNPALAQPGASMTVAGSGFDGGSTVDVLLSPKGEETGTELGWFKTDKSGGLNAQVTLPDNIQASSVIVTARQQNSDNIATAEAVTAAGMGFAKLSKTTGKPGDTVTVNARGFSPGEKIKVYWGRASGVPTSTVQADESGNVSKAPIRVGVGQVGEATLVLVGDKSGTTATVPFYMLGLYPTVEATPYALKAGEPLGLSANGFAPEERVLIYVNTSSGPPAMTARADTQGNIGGLGFKVPFGLKGSQSIVMVGEKSRASVSSGFQVLPYTPSAQTSTYGGSPGTSFSFFAKDFAPNEVVMVYLGRTKWDAGELVSAFRVNDQGAAGAAGRFQITGSDQGTLSFTLIGRQSGGKASTSLKVTPATGPVDIPPRQPYKFDPKSLD